MIIFMLKHMAVSTKNKNKKKQGKNRKTNAIQPEIT
jgi:hypothetical protein